MATITATLQKYVSSRGPTMCNNVDLTANSINPNGDVVRRITATLQQLKIMPRFR